MKWTGRLPPKPVQPGLCAPPAMFIGFVAGRYELYVQFRRVCRSASSLAVGLSNYLNGRIMHDAGLRYFSNIHGYQGSTTYFSIHPYLLVLYH